MARAASAGSVTGVDLSARMLDLARRRSQDVGVTNVEFLQGDAQVRIVATIAGYDTPATKKNVSLVLNGKTVQSKTVDVAANGRAQAEEEHREVEVSPLVRGIDPAQQADRHQHEPGNVKD